MHHERRCGLALIMTQTKQMRVLQGGRPWLFVPSADIV